MAIEDGLCLAMLVDATSGDFDRAFRQFAAERCLRTARVTLESRYLWEVYHADGIARDVYRRMLGERAEADVLRCLAWLYDGMGGLADGRDNPASARLG